MKKIISMLLFCLIAGFINAQTVSESKQQWDYPIKPGSVKWASFATGQQMRDACQIPPYILESLSTKDLVAICLNYPLWIDFVLSNDERKGISNIIKGFNGLSELSKRKNCMQELINVYKNYPVFSEIPEKSSKNYTAPLKQAFLELILSDDLFSKHLDEQLAAELGKIVLRKYGEKVNNMEVYSLFLIKKSILLGAVIMDIQNRPSISSEKKKTIKRFIENYSNLDSELLSETSKIIIEL
jgi:hypothetical protein